MDGFWALVALNFTVGALHIGFLTWMPSFLMDDYGFGLETAGMLAAVFILLGAVSSPVGGLIASRYGRKRMVLLTSTFILFLVLGIVAGLHLYLTLAMMFGLGWFLYFHFGAYFSLANELIGGRHVSVSLGLFNCIGITGAMFPPVLTGVLLDSTGSYQAGFLPLFVIAVVGIIGALLVWRLKQK
jgi:nitrate/nitrite transporter NarK